MLDIIDFSFCILNGSLGTVTWSIIWKTGCKINFIEFNFFSSVLLNFILLTVSTYINSSNWKCIRKIELDTVLRNSHSEVFFRKGVLKISSKFTGEHPWRSAYFQNASSTEHLWMAASVFWYALCQIPDFLTLRVLSYGLTDMLCTSNSFPFWMVHLGQCYQLHRLWVSTDVCVLLVYILYFVPSSSLF